MEAVQRRDSTGERQINGGGQLTGGIICAVAGIIGSTPEGLWADAYGLAQNLLLASEHRGKDATGYVARTAPYGSLCLGTILLAKRPLSASEFVNTTEFTRLRHRRLSSLILHARLATHGSALLNTNNHPHVSRNGAIALVHNGVVSNVDDLRDEYQLKLASECDSEVILRILEQSKDVGSGLNLALKKVRGSMAVAVYDAKSDCCWLASNGGRSLWLAHLPKFKCWMFASTEGIILEAMQQSFGNRAGDMIDVLIPLADYVPVALSPKGLVYAPKAQFTE